MTETESTPKKYGFQIDTVTIGFVSSVVEIYEDTVGETLGSQMFKQQLSLTVVDDIKSELSKQGYCERRLGSSLDSNSKLIIRMSRRDNLGFVQFNPNLDFNQKDAVLKDKADKMKNEFESRINEFLLNSGKGVELKI